MIECPICAEPAGDRIPRCARCGWELHAGPFLGWADDAELAEFQQRFELAAAEWDLAAAVRSGVTRDEAAHLDLRGGPAGDAAWRATDSDQGASEVPAETPSGGLAEVLRRLSDGTTEVVHFVGANFDHLAHQQVVADGSGFPVLDGRQTKFDWELASLPSERVRRRFQLAGGRGLAPVERACFDRAVRGAISALHGGELVFVGPPKGLIVLLDRARDIVTEKVPEAASVVAGPEPFDLEERVAAALESAPLPRDVDVVLQRLDPSSGCIDLVTKPLFEAGTRAPGSGSLPPREVVVYGPPVRGGAPIVPVVARTGDDPVEWRVLALGQTSLAPTAKARLLFTLEGLTTVHIAREDGAPVSRVDLRLRELIDAIPERVPAVPPIDVVCAVELAGTQEAVRERLDFAEHLIDAVVAYHPRPSVLRFGAVGYLDHRDRATALYPSNRVVLGGGEPGTVEATRGSLRTWRASEPLRDAATAMEDALAKVAGLRWNRSAAAERVLVLIGRRPPCEPRRAGPIAACPHGMDWRTYLRLLRERRVRIVGVREPDPVTAMPGSDGDAIRAHAAWCWRVLADGGLFELGADTADVVGGAITAPSDVSPDAFPLGLVAPLGEEPRDSEVRPATREKVISS